MLLLLVFACPLFYAASIPSTHISFPKLTIPEDVLSRYNIPADTFTQGFYEKNVKEANEFYAKLDNETKMNIKALFTQISEQMRNRTPVAFVGELVNAGKPFRAQGLFELLAAHVLNIADLAIQLSLNFNFQIFKAFSTLKNLKENDRVIHCNTDPVLFTTANYLMENGCSEFIEAIKEKPSIIHDVESMSHEVESTYRRVEDAMFDGETMTLGEIVQLIETHRKDTASISHLYYSIIDAIYKPAMIDKLQPYITLLSKMQAQSLNSENVLSVGMDVNEMFHELNFAAANEEKF